MRKRKIKKWPIVLAVLIVLIAGAACAGYFMGYWGINNGKIWFISKENSISDKTPVMFFEHEGSFVSVNKAGQVTVISFEATENLPKLSGLGFAVFETGDFLVCERESDFSYTLKAARDIQDYVLPISEIIIDENGEITLIYEKVKVLLGADDATDDKLRDLGYFIDKLKGMKGTLDMKKTGSSSMGYTFKKEE